ncbi:hypothetical protein [Lutimaribacter saemankumensis]|uniref:Secreted protein n=1 Tax=Lutimaribacter saemankumensis TaxID=490829 RepID=A0A1G8L665_9RHOB|nr:hypothetical protein [Lutimaribacter saemankumensis]SDI51189.1 hypothetical protein SAMN05421850_103195 [Lutimaribacter saemankumensis]
MKFKSVFTAIAITLAAAVPASATEAKTYPYHAKENHCPSGLQPIVMAGVICCGTPNQPMTYSQMQAHPAGYRKTVERSGRRMVCPAGEKGCFYQ